MPSDSFSADDSCSRWRSTSSSARRCPTSATRTRIGPVSTQPTLALDMPNWQQSQARATGAEPGSSAIMSAGASQVVVLSRKVPRTEASSPGAQIYRSKVSRLIRTGVWS